MLQTFRAHAAAILAVVGVLVFFAGAARAVGEDGLYTARVPVASGDEAARKPAIRAALARVLVKLTGRRDVGRDPRARELLDHAEDWVSEYRYLAQPEGTEGYLLEVRFQPARVRAALRKAGLPMWPTPRPGILLWLAVEEAGARRLLESADPALEAAARTARERGLDLLLPLLDLEDRSRVQATDLLGGFDESVREASERYTPDGVLIAAGKRTRDGTWRMDWRLYLGEARLDWRTRDTPLEAAVTEGIQVLADRLARRTSPASGQEARQGVLLVAVDGVNSLAAFAQVHRFLAQSSVLQQVRPWRIAPGTVVFHTSTQDPEGVARILGTRGSPLEPLPEAAGLESVGAGLVRVQHFRWRQGGAPAPGQQQP